MKALVTICIWFTAVMSVSAQRILSYNVRNAKGMDNSTDYDRVAAVIRSQQPDIVALQELDSATLRSKGVDVLQTLAQKTGMHYSFSASISYNGGKYGIGLLSKEKPLSLVRIPLPGKEEARSLLIAQFRDYLVFNTHLSLTPEDQLSSARIINEQVAAYRQPVYLCGDLNATPGSATILELEKKWVLLSGTANSFPADNPNRCIDYIFSFGNNRSLVKAEVVNEPMASDHRPVLVVLE